MKKGKLDPNGGGRLKLTHIMLLFAGMYLLFVCLEFFQLFGTRPIFNADESTKSLDDLIRESLGEEEDQDRPFFRSLFYKDTLQKRVDDRQSKNAPQRPQKESFRLLPGTVPINNPVKPEYGRISGAILEQMNETKELSELQRMAKDAWVVGLKAWKEAEEATTLQGNQSIAGHLGEGAVEPCPQSISLTGQEMEKSGHMMHLPCGLTLGSSITLIGTPRKAHIDYSPKISGLKDDVTSVFVSQFMLELHGPKIVNGEESPKMLPAILE